MNSNFVENIELSNNIGFPNKVHRISVYANVTDKKHEIIPLSKFNSKTCLLWIKFLYI